MLSAPDADVDEVEEALVVRLVPGARVVPAAVPLVEFRDNDVYVDMSEVVGEWEGDVELLLMLGLVNTPVVVALVVPVAVAV